MTVRRGLKGREKERAREKGREKERAREKGRKGHFEIEEVKTRERQRPDDG